MSVAEEDVVKVTLRLPRELHQRLRVVLAHDGRSAQTVLEGMVAAWVERKEAEQNG